MLWSEVHRSHEGWLVARVPGGAGGVVLKRLYEEYDVLGLLLWDAGS